MKNHVLYMHRALQLGKLGAGKVAPNPMVGCVIVHNDRIIGEGYHQKYGDLHAEVNAINSVENKEILSESTVYVSLEPCAHFGKTPPCADLLIACKVAKVVICNADPNPLVAGKGIDKLKAAEIQIITGVLEKEGLELNKHFFTFFNKKRPFIILKWAQTSNGFIAGEKGKPIKISNQFSSKYVHKLRAETEAIMVGTNTVFNDNPSLTTRHWTGKNPVRILIDKQLRFKQELNIFDFEADSLIYNLHGDGKISNAQYVQLPDESDFLVALINDLYQKKINSILVEGGTKLLESFMKLNLWDEAKIIVSPNKLEKGIPAPNFDFSLANFENFANDKVYSLKNINA